MNAPDKHLYEFGPYRLDPDQRLLLRDNQPIPLQPKAFDTLLVLIRHQQEVVPKDDLMKSLWPDSFVEEANLSQNIFVLRKALGAAGGRYIVTVPGRGYRFVQAVKEIQLQNGDLVVQSHKQSSVLIEEKGEEGLEQAAGTPGFQNRGLLSGRVQSEKWSSRGIVALILGAAAIGALGAWAWLQPAPAAKVLRSVQLTHTGRVEPFGRVLSDGSRVYFTERIGGSWALAETTEQGGEPSVLSTSVSGVALYDLDPTRSRFLLGEQRPADESLDPLWVMPTTGGSGRRLGDILAGDASWAPDGRSIVYARQGAIFVAGEDGQDPRKLFSIAGLIMHPRWSPDGRHLSFTVRDLSNGGVLSLWEMDADGRNPHRLSLGWKDPTKRYNEGECCADWSPDGRYFVFRSLRDGVKSLWAVRTNGSRFGKGASAPLLLYTSPDWIGVPRFSADGKKIFFADYQERRELMRYDSGRKLFVPYLGGIAARNLSFSADGEWVAYRNEADGTLWRSRTDGTQALQLTFPPVDAIHSTWSPDGRKIAYDAGGHLYMIPVEGGNSELLTAGSQPSWSPDGSALILARWGMAASGSWSPAIYRLNLSTRQAEMLAGSENFEGPEWSPDGRFAAVSDKKDQKLMLYDFERRQWSELADGLPYGWGIRWSRDSKYVYYQHVYGQEQPIFRVQVSNHKVEQITSSRQILRADVLSYSMTGLTPDNSPLTSLARRTSDVYALEVSLP